MYLGTCCNKTNDLCQGQINLLVSVTLKYSLCYILVLLHSKFRILSRFVVICTYDSSELSSVFASCKQYKVENQIFEQYLEFFRGLYILLVLNFIHFTPYLLPEPLKEQKITILTKLLPSRTFYYLIYVYYLIILQFLF